MCDLGAPYIYCYLLNMGDFYKLAILFEISVAVWFCFFFWLCYCSQNVSWSYQLMSTLLGGTSSELTPLGDKAV